MCYLLFVLSALSAMETNQTGSLKLLKKIIPNVVILNLEDYLPLHLL